MANLSDKNFYVYRHVRLDTYVPFYVGEGKMSRNRAFHRGGRNNYWHNIVNKAGYRVDIIAKNLTKEEALNLELWFKTLYTKLGFKLANYRVGREDKNYTYTPEAVERRAKQLRGRNLSKEHIANIPTKFKPGHVPWNKGKPRPEMYGTKYGQKYGTVYCFELDKLFNTPKEASEQLGISYCNILRVCKGERISAGKLTFKFTKDL